MLYGPSGLLQINYESLKHCEQEEPLINPLAEETDHNPDSTALDTDPEGKDVRFIKLQ